MSFLTMLIAAKLAGGSVTPEQLADAASAWLEANITNPTDPAIDTSLAVSGAAADSKTVGDALATGVMLRSTLAADTDMDTIIQPGIYYKAAAVAITNAPPETTSARARVVVFSGGDGTSVVQVWYDTGNKRAYVRMNSASGGAWSAWARQVTLGTLDNAIMPRTELVADTDMDTVVQPGIYFKQGSVALVHAPDDSTSTRARVVVYGSGTGNAVVQIWHNVTGHKMWLRSISVSDGAWSAWECIATTAFGDGSRYPGPVFERAAQVYAALDALEAASGGRITHTALTESLDNDNLPTGETADDNKMRLYKVDLTPAHMIPGSYAISNTPLYPKPKALITACIHGDERASATYVVDFAKRLLDDPEFNAVASAVEWYIVPVVNVYGFNHDTRANAPRENYPNGIDINRDFSDTPYTYYERTYGFVSAEAQAIRDLYRANTFVFYLDVHQADFSSDTPRCGFCSCINEQPDRLNDYKKLWRAIDRAGAAATIWVKSDNDTIKTNAQIAYGWGDVDNPPLGADTTASATTYIRGNTHWNTSAQNPDPVFATCCVETNQRCNLISGSDTDFNKVAMTFGAVYVQSLIKELVTTVLDNFDVYGT